MSEKTIEFYTPKQVKELRKIKREFPTPRKRTGALKEWAEKNGRSFAAVRAKVGKLRKARGPYKKTASLPAPRIHHTEEETFILRFKILNLSLSKDELTIECSR